MQILHKALTAAGEELDDLDPDLFVRGKVALRGRHSVTY